MRFRPRGLTTRAKTLGSILALVAMTIGTQGSALANPVPDSEAMRLPRVTFPVLPTLPFALGEVDFSSIGVTDEEVADAGLSGDEPIAPMASESDKFVVDDDNVQCPDADFATIQDAVDAAGPGDRVEVCPGAYMEQVTIPAGKDGLTLLSKKNLAAVIRAPAIIADPGAIVRVAESQNVTIRDFTISGPGPVGSGLNCLPAGTLRWGIRVDMGGSAVILKNHITEIHDTPFSGCQRGHGVNIGRMSEGQVGHATVRHNLIDNYQKGGVLVDGPGTTADVNHNEIVGLINALIAGNGIQISRNAEGTVDHNKVSRNQYTPDPQASGILLYMLSSQVSANHNKVWNNDYGVVAWFSYSIEMAHNKSENNTLKGIAAISPTSDILISHNDAKNNGEHDCYDETVPSMNTWEQDKGDTQNQPGLCKKAQTTP